MRIQIKKWDGQGDFTDPKTGQSFNANAETVRAILGGQVITGVGGVNETSEAVVINFHDGSAIWFVTAGGPPRILLRSKPTS